jgi:hypothetical protein
MSPLESGESSGIAGIVNSIQMEQQDFDHSFQPKVIVQHLPHDSRASKEPFDLFI